MSAPERCCSHEPLTLTLRAGGPIFVLPCQIAMVQPGPQGTTMTRVRLHDGLDVFVRETPEVVLVQRRHALGAEPSPGWPVHSIVATSDIGPVDHENGGQP